MTVLVMMRHAETAWSREGRIQGSTDVPLSEAGRNALLGRTLPEEFRNMCVVTSPLRRCAETAALLGLAAAVPEQRIAEMHWGAWEGHVLADLRIDGGEAMRENESRGLDFMPPGGESPRGVLRRVSAWLGDVAQTGLPTLAIAHRGIIRVLLAAATDWDMRGRPPVKFDWAALHVFSLDVAGRPSVVRVNVPLVAKHLNVAAG